MKKKTPSTYEHALWLMLGLCAFAFSSSYENWWVKVFGLLAGLAIYSGSIMAVTRLIKSYEHKSQTVNGLIGLYVESALLFAVAYSCAYILAPSGTFIEGLHTACKQSGECPGAEGYMAAILDGTMLFLDALYYSIATMTTLGDASITANSWVRFVVASQVSFTFYVTVIGLAQAFSKETEARTQRIIKTELKNHAHSNQNVEHEPVINGLGNRWRAAWKVLRSGRRV